MEQEAYFAGVQMAIDLAEYTIDTLDDPVEQAVMKRFVTAMRISLGHTMATFSGSGSIN